MPYAELRCHSAFSFGDGACSPEALVERAAAMGYGALGLTDTADLGGAIRFALACEAAGIRPVVGAELVVDGYPAAFYAMNERGFRNLAGLVTRARVGSSLARADSRRSGPGVVIAESAEDAEDAENDERRRELREPGDQHSHRHHPDSVPVEKNPRSADARDPSSSGPIAATSRYVRAPAPPSTALISASSASSAPSAIKKRRKGLDVHDRSRGKPMISWRDLQERSEGLYALTGPATGEIATHLRARRRAEATLALARWETLFGENFAIEVQLHHVSGAEAALAGALIDLARASSTPWVATNEPRYLDSGGRLVHDVLTALRHDADLDTAASFGFLHPNGEWRLKSPLEMAALWQGREEGLEQSQRIALACGFDLRWLRPPLPRFPVPPGHDDDSWLRVLAYEGAARRWGQLDDRQTAQLDHELSVIARLGFAGFFLVMWDAVAFARRSNILCQGRGSAANSAVAYCLEITAVDPIRHGLLFERFLSEHRTDGRTEAPDIDVDFEMHRREEVLNYMYEKYGRQHAAITAVTQMYSGPTGVQDLMRGLGYPVELAFSLSKRLHHVEPSDAAEAIEAGLGVEMGLDITTPKARALLSALRALDGVPRLRSTHPGGFVLSRDPLGDVMPIEHTTMGRTIIQFDKDDLDAAGVPKFDFLGLGGLSAVHIAFDAVEKRTGEKMELYSLPIDDEKTFEMISRGDTIGTFQIESRAQIQSILQTRPDRLYDLVVQVALIRPGPIQAKFVRPYTRRRRGLEEPEYRHPLLEPILKRTQGIPIFQEQAMAISMALAGYTAADADQLRRAMGHHRKIARLEAELARLRQAMAARGIDVDVATEIVDDLHVFANYGFPESHAWSFALIAYATSYLKAHFHAEFTLGMLNAWPMGFYPPSTLVHDARRHGVTVLPPCLKDGAWECTLEPQPGNPESPGNQELPAKPNVNVSANHPDPEAPPRSESAGTHAPRAVPVNVDLNVRSGKAAVRVHENSAQAAATASPDKPSRALTSESHPVNVNAKVYEDVNGESPTAAPALRVGWKFIRGLGDDTADRLHAAHLAAPFTSVEDVVRRAALTRAEALHIARAGAFEAFEPGRRRAAWEALRAAGDDLPLAPARRLPFEPRELQGEELVFLDYLATGICTHGHPVEHLRPRLQAAGVAGAGDLDRYEDGDHIIVAGLVIARQHPSTAKGTVFVLLEDEHGFVNVIVPAKTYERNREVVRFSPFLVVEGVYERDDRVVSVVGQRFRRLDSRDLMFRSRDFR